MPAMPTSLTSSIVVVDTSVWISWLLPGDPNHIIALNWISSYAQGGGSLLSPTMLVIEISSGVSRATGQPVLARRAVSQVYSLPFIRIVPMDENLVRETTSVAADHKLRGADAVFVALAKIEAMPLVTFDEEQLSRPAGVITTIRPG